MHRTSGRPAIDLCDLNETSQTFDDRSRGLKLVLIAEEDPETRRSNKFYSLTLSLSIRYLCASESIPPDITFALNPFCTRMRVA